jgi:hypothetical protein
MDAKDGKETKRATYLAGDSGKDDVRALVVLVVSTRLILGIAECEKSACENANNRHHDSAEKLLQFHLP